ncbi:hypothetical protein Lal_00014909 [Lupinus albus]|nr:hypothetical protein Lal_00014909 [Lupinus albus]
MHYQRRSPVFASANARAAIMARLFLEVHRVRSPESLASVPAAEAAPHEPRGPGRRCQGRLGDDAADPLVRRQLQRFLHAPAESRRAPAGRRRFRLPGGRRDQPVRRHRRPPHPAGEGAPLHDHGTGRRRRGARQAVPARQLREPVPVAEGLPPPAHAVRRQADAHDLRAGRPVLREPDDGARRAEPVRPQRARRLRVRIAGARPVRARARGRDDRRQHGHRVARRRESAPHAERDGVDLRRPRHRAEKGRRDGPLPARLDDRHAVPPEHDPLQPGLGAGTPRFPHRRRRPAGHAHGLPGRRARPVRVRHRVDRRGPRLPVEIAAVRRLGAVRGRRADPPRVRPAHPPAGSLRPARAGQSARHARARDDDLDDPHARPRLRHRAVAHRAVLPRDAVRDRRALPDVRHDLRHEAVLGVRRRAGAGRLAAGTAARGACRRRVCRRRHRNRVRRHRAGQPAPRRGRGPGARLTVFSRPFAFPDVLGHDEVRARRDAAAVARDFGQQLRRIGRHPGRQLLFPAHLAALQDPRHGAAGAAEDAQQVVPQQIVRMLGQAPLRKIGRRRIQAELLDRDAARGQRGIFRQVAHADRDIEVFRDEVHAPRRQIQFQRHGRVACHERRDHVGHDDVGEILRQRDAQLAAGRRLAVLGQRAGRLDLFRHLARVLQQARAELRQHQAARRPLQQALAHARLQQRDAARHGRLRQIEALGRHAEAAGLDDTGEQQQVIRFDIHGLFH